MESDEEGPNSLQKRKKRANNRESDAFFQRLYSKKRTLNQEKRKEEVEKER